LQSRLVLVLRSSMIARTIGVLNNIGFSFNVLPSL
jgi:hypothetical protein